jgi:hypothetical protein
MLTTIYDSVVLDKFNIDEELFGKSHIEDSFRTNLMVVNDLKGDQAFDLYHIRGRIVGAPPSTLIGYVDVLVNDQLIAPHINLNDLLVRDYTLDYFVKPIEKLRVIVHALLEDRPFSYLYIYLGGYRAGT